MLRNRITTPFFAPEDGSGAAALANAAAPQAPAPAKEEDILAAVMSDPAPANTPAATRKAAPVDPATAPTGAVEDTKPAPQAAPDASAGQDEGDGDEGDDPDFFDPFSEDTNTTSQQASDDEGADAVVHKVTVDGQEVEVTLGELKRRYSGEGAIEKRLQEATQERTAAKTASEQAAARLREADAATAAHREQLAHAITALRSLLVQPRLRQPDPALRQTNPNQYLADMEAFRAEQTMLQQRGAQLDTVLQAHEQARQETLVQTKQREAQLLAQAMPVFRDPVKGKKTYDMIVDMATKSGFQPAEIAGLTDHRMFVVAAKAAMYDQLMAKAKGGKVVPSTVTIPAKGGAPKNPARQQAAQMAAKVSKAKETGSVDDIANTLLLNPSRKR